MFHKNFRIYETASNIFCLIFLVKSGKINVNKESRRRLLRRALCYKFYLERDGLGCSHPFLSDTKFKRLALLFQQRSNANQNLYNGYDKHSDFVLPHGLPLLSTEVANTSTAHLRLYCSILCVIFQDTFINKKCDRKKRPHFLCLIFRNFYF